MINIQYRSHLILQSKYRLITNLILYTLFYLFITNNQVSYCMTEGTEIPEIAEAKSEPSHQVQALKREIVEFIGTQLPLLEQIKIQEEKITELTQSLQNAENTIKANFTAHSTCLTDLRLLEQENIRILHEIRALPERINKEDILQLIYNSDGRIFEEKVRAGRIRMPGDSYKDY